ncbi:MAG: DUF488 domain-containing protein [Nitrococcus sp.]|nr:DUF488 domain-containing protein [Nitrococcus sp.]
MQIWTIGHSNYAFDTFLDLLRRHQLEAVVDVRRFPGSRRQPQYSREQLRNSLAEHGLKYHWLPALGGRRRPLPNSPNSAWRNASFRGYADYMASDAFSEGLEELLGRAIAARTTLMCAEAVWWRCHRALIADALRVRGVDVFHMLGANQAVVHPYTSPARIVEGRLFYTRHESES